jgi:hypothetical protein
MYHPNGDLVSIVSQIRDNERQRLSADVFHQEMIKGDITALEHVYDSLFKKGDEHCRIYFKRIKSMKGSLELLHRTDVNPVWLLRFMLWAKSEGYHYLYLGGCSCGPEICKHHFDKPVCIEINCDDSYKYSYFKYTSAYERYGITSGYNGSNYFEF